jgi:hypothetical protein
MPVSSSTPLDDYVGVYLDSLKNGSSSSDDGKSISSSSIKHLEFEVKFGTGRTRKEITKIDNDNVTHRIMSNGFVLKSNSNLLRIYPSSRSYRVEISGMDKIINYCKSNKLVDEPFIEKNNVTIKKDGRSDELRSYDYDDFNFRISLKTEETIKSEDIERRSKTFRFMSRNTFIRKDPKCPLQIDISVVKTSSSSTFMNSNIMSSSSNTTYEIEIELLNDVCVKMEKEKIGSYLRNIIKLIMSGFQNSNFPISNNEQHGTVNEYMKLIWGSRYRDNGKILSKHFMGPSSFTLQIPNIIEIDKPSTISANIRYDYTVTEKADGERKLLFINPTGRLYFINTNMNIQFTGIITSDKHVFNTIIDGEHITHDKEHKYINLYAAFDIYYLDALDVRERQFSHRMDSISEKAGSNKKGRLELLGETMGLLNSSMTTISGEPAASNKSGILRLTVKKFYPERPEQSIFECCGILLDKKDSYEYNTDGLIFTPMKMAVGQLADGRIPLEPEKRGWEFSLKWKPPEFNTIDFLATTRKTEEGKDFVGYMNDLKSVDELKQYKSLELRVGFDEKQHGYIDPLQTLIDGVVSRDSFNEDVDGYRPVKFYPTNPTVENAHICNIILSDNGTVENAMLSEEGEVIEDKMIIECRYDNDENDGWKWKPLRVRYDKTAEFRNGGRNFGNPYHVANSNWNTIHHPISIEMLTTGSGIEQVEDEEVYYKKSAADNTRGLRDFHNKFVKSKLLGSVSTSQSILIDYAVGKAGDLPKWIDSRLKFVFGMDISLDNIQNRIDGACARFLNQTKMRNKNRSSSNLAALFAVGDSSKNIRNMDAITSDKYKQITNAVMGRGSKDESVIGRGVVKQWGIGMNGFDISSIQFAIHYMFKNLKTLLGFLRNVSENTKLNGYFVGTCYDGETVFNKLAGKPNLSIYKDDNSVSKEKIWEIVKKYEEKTFQSDKSSLGYEISVFQESIGSYFSEYLVNFKFLDTVLQHFGFVRLTDSEAKKIGLPAGTGMFDLLFNQMNETRERDMPYRMNTMTTEERKISFLNRYFVYVKRFNVESVKIEQMLLSSSTISSAVIAPAQAPAPVLRQPTSPAPVLRPTAPAQEAQTSSSVVERTVEVKEKPAGTLLTTTKPTIVKEIGFNAALSKATDALELAKTAESNDSDVSVGLDGAAPLFDEEEQYKTRNKLRSALLNASVAITTAITQEKSGKYVVLLKRSLDALNGIQIPESRRLTYKEREALTSILKNAHYDLTDINKYIRNAGPASASASAKMTHKQPAVVADSSVVQKTTRKIKLKLKPSEKKST